MVKIPDHDLRVDVSRTGTHYRVQLLHLPTGMIAISDSEPTEQQNRKLAMRELKRQLAVTSGR